MKIYVKNLVSRGSLYFLREKIPLLGEKIRTSGGEIRYFCPKFLEGGDFRARNDGILKEGCFVMLKKTSSALVPSKNVDSTKFTPSGPLQFSAARGVHLRESKHLVLKQFRVSACCFSLCTRPCTAIPSQTESRPSALGYDLAWAANSRV